LGLLPASANWAMLTWGIAQKQDKGLWDFPVFLAEFSPDSVA